MIPRLLAGRDELSRPEQDAIFERVAAPAPTARRWWWLAAPVLVAGIVLVAVAPWRPADDFAARGGSRPIAALHVTCSGACAPGAKLLFDVHGTSAYRYFAAFAKRGDGTGLWYFPTAHDAAGAEPRTPPA